VGWRWAARHGSSRFGSWRRSRGCHVHADRHSETQ
jgi:hypothetical protein